MPYEATSLSGTLLTTSPEASAPNTTYPLAASGPHAISVGILADNRAIVAVRLPLTGDDTFSVLKQPVAEGHGESIHELF